MAECLEEDLADEWDNNGLGQRDRANSSCSSSSCAPLNIESALAEGVASDLPLVLLDALKDFYNTAVDIRVQSLESIDHSIQLLAPKVGAIKTVTTALAEWQAPEHFKITWDALRQWLVTESSGPVGLLQELTKSQLECSDTTDSDALGWHIDNIKFNIPHTCRRLLAELKVLQFVAEREKQKVEKLACATQARSSADRAVSSTERTLKASVASMADNDLQKLLAQRLAGNRGC